MGGGSIKADPTRTSSRPRCAVEANKHAFPDATRWEGCGNRGGSAMTDKFAALARPKVQPLKRRKLTRVEFAQLLLVQNGRCPRCCEKLVAERIIDEHLIPLDQGGTNALENRALYCTACARSKTAEDVSTSARGRRLRGETGQRKRQTRRKAGQHARPSFSTNREGPWKRKMDGTVEPRPRRVRRKKIKPFVLVG